MDFDPMAAAIDWLDAYRAGDIEAILEMHADGALVDCGCGGRTVIAGKEALRAYWVDRIRNFPVSDLDNLQPSGDGALISFVTHTGVVSGVLAFNANGKITQLTCGPSH